MLMLKKLMVVKNFIVPFSSISTLEKKGNMRYSISGGTYDSNNKGTGKRKSIRQKYFMA